MKRFILLTLLGGNLLLAQAQQLAFPGAEGFGKYAVGGRNGSVYHVTNLKDSGAGSLRDAVSQPNRIVVFDVAGVIKLESRLVFKNNLYVAGQTAPGEGITVYGNGVSFSGANNTIVRYLRFRMGIGGDSGKDAAGVANGTNMIFDHLSVSWGRDETFSISSDGKGDLGDITIQNSIISQGLMGHSAGGLIQADNITLYRNLYVDNSTRNNKVKGKNQYVNNIVYNWQNGCYIMGGDSEGSSYSIAEGNLFINGPAKGGNAFTGGNARVHMYANDNWQDRDMDGVFDPYEIPQSEYSGGPTFQSTRFDYPVVPLWSAKELLTNSLPTVGASLPYRDHADWYVINEVLSLGKKGALISTEETLPIGIPTSWGLWAGNKKTDTDGDGMPDAWEMANGTDANKNDAMVIAENGYANIENYINSITVEDREAYLRTPLCLEATSSTQNTLTLGWYNYTEGEDGIAIEMKKDNGFEEIIRTEADASACVVENLQPGTPYVFRIRAFDKEGNYSAYTQEVTMKTRPVAVEMVDIATYEADYSWSGANGIWDKVTDNWLDCNENSSYFEDNSKVLFNPADDVSVTLNETVSPAVVVVKDAASVSITGTGAIGGTASVNKTGEGTLVLNTANTYTGQTVLHGGTIEFNSLTNAGTASSIGASEEFAQNWIWNGGVWKYTGATTSTNRSAKLYEDTELDIADSKAVVTMTGVLEGEGSFILNGKGELKLTETDFFSYNGATILKGGILNLSNEATTKCNLGKSGKLILAGGELKTAGLGSKEDYDTYSFPIEVQEGTHSYFTPNRNCYIKSKVTGSGTIQINIPYLREYIQGDWTNFTGRVIANGTYKDGALFLLNGNNNDMPNAVVELKGGANMAGWSTNCDFVLGGLSGDAGTYVRGSSKKDSGFKCSWTVGGAGTDETFRGVINNYASSSTREGTVSITKEGAGDWRLTGNNVYKGTTTVKGGRLIVNGTHSGTGAITVYDEATLRGRGTLAGKVTVKEGGVIAAGDTLVNNAHSFKLNGGLTVEKGGIVEATIYTDMGDCRACVLAPAKTLTLNDAILKINMDAESADYSMDDEFQIFKISSSTTVSGTGIAQIIPAQPAADLYWDTSDLLKTGVLRVSDKPASIDGLTDNAISVWPLAVENQMNVTVPCDTQMTMYSLTGEQVKNMELQSGTTAVNVAALSNGLYIVKAGNKIFRVVKK